jgi:cell division septation protein DedD
MDWIRRNWPDLLIGLALLLVIGGIIATLLNGGNFLPFGRGSQPATVSGASTTTTAPVTPESTAPVNTATNSSESVAAVDLNAPSATESVSVGDETGTIVAVLPGEAPDAATTAIDQAADATVPATQADPATAATVQDSTTQVTPASETPSAPYRISVGAFGSAENAERKAQSFKDAGYPVFVGRQGDLSLVLIGPYNSQGEAEQVKAQLQSSGLEANPIVYEFRPEGAAASSASAETAPATTESATTEAVAATPNTTEATTTALPTTGSGRYLQVGAYGDQTAAAPQRSLLEGLGFTVSSVEEGEFVKLLVGPYDDTALNDAQGRLSAQGIDSFVR